MIKPHVAVIMSVYKSDKLMFVTEAVESILTQTYESCDLYVAVDGPISNEVKLYLANISDLENVFLIFGDLNKGLAFRLNQLISIVIEKSKYQYIARMDADDISIRTRIEKQVSFLNENQDISVVGSDLVEINESGEKIFYKKMSKSHEQLEKNIIKKCPFNHPTVMFKIDVFLTSIRYNESLMNTQDYYLWVDLLNAGFKFENISEALLKFRIDGDFHSRRGFKKAINDLKSRVYAFRVLKCYSTSNFLHVLLLFILRISPPFIKAFAYKKFR